MTTIFIADGKIAADRCTTIGSVRTETRKLFSHDGKVYGASGNTVLIGMIIEALQKGEPLPREYPHLKENSADANIYGSADGITTSIILANKEAGTTEVVYQTMATEYALGIGTGSGWKITQGAWLMGKDFFRALDGASYADDGTGHVWDVYDFNTKEEKVYYAGTV